MESLGDKQIEDKGFEMDQQRGDKLIEEEKLPLDHAHDLQHQELQRINEEKQEVSERNNEPR